MTHSAFRRARDNRLAAMGRAVACMVRTSLHELKLDLIDFAIGTMAITGVSLAFGVNPPIITSAAKAPPAVALWPAQAVKLPTNPRN